MMEKNIPEYYWDDCIERFLEFLMDLNGYAEFIDWIDEDNNIIDYIENP